jgi:hypothetical protein
MEFRLSQSLSRIFLSHDGVLAITKPSHELLFLTKEFWLSRSLSHEFFSFSRWNSDYQGAFSRISLSHDGILAIKEPFHEFLFHTIEFWLSRSLFTNFSFTRWNSSYQEAFSRIFLLHDGILAIKEPFHEFLFHTMEFWLSRSLFMNFSFTQWNSGYQGAFSRIFLLHDGIHKMHDLGEDTFHIYHKDYLHRIRLVKNIASWFRAPFARKRVCVGAECGPDTNQ